MNVNTIWLWLTVSHGKIHPFVIGKPSISMGHGFHGYVTNKQRVLTFIPLLVLLFSIVFHDFSVQQGERTVEVKQAVEWPTSYFLRLCLTRIDSWCQGRSGCCEQIPSINRSYQRPTCIHSFENWNNRQWHFFPYKPNKSLGIWQHIYIYTWYTLW